MKSFVKELLIGCSSLLMRDRGPKIIFYHDVFDQHRHTDMGTPLSLLRTHIERARECGYVFTNYMLNSSARTADKTLHMAFDDGFRGIYDCRQFFVENRLYPTISIAPDLVGQEGYLTWAEIRELQSIGFDFQSHTWTHRSLTKVSPTEWEHELADSRKFISDQLQQEVRALCFPRGLFDAKILQASLTAGYTTLYSSVPGPLNAIQSLLQNDSDARLYTRHLVQFSSPSEFGSVLKGGLSLFCRYYLKRHYLG